MQGDSMFVTVSFAPIEHMRYSAIVPVYLDGNLSKVSQHTATQWRRGPSKLASC